MSRLGIIGIVIQGDRAIAGEVQNLLSQYGDIIIGRMGVPDRQHDRSAISLIVEGEASKISALSAALGRLDNVKVKSALMAVDPD